MRDARPWTYAALFGALWGAFELSIGTILQMGRLPLRGVLLGVFGILCLVTLRRLQPQSGVCLLAGVVTMFLKVFSLGGLYPGPLIGIGAQAVLVELCFAVAGTSVLAAVLGGAAALMAGPVQMFATMWVVAGREAVDAMAATMAGVVVFLGLPRLSAAAVIAMVIGLSGSLGALAGVWAWRVGGRVRKRLGRPS